jgi:hypothetical protein
MRIGRDDNFLSLERVEPDDPHSPWRVEAVATAKGQRFSAAHDRVMLDTSEETIQKFAEFESLATQRVEVRLTEGGWVRLERDAHGAITVSYRLASWKGHAVLKGEVVVEGEFAGACCRELAALLRGPA